MRRVLSIATLILALDQVSKWLVVHWLDLWFRGEMDVFPPFLTFRMTWNYGVNFGLFPARTEAMKWVLILIALVIVGFVLWWIRKHRQRPIALWSAGLLIGGAIGNVVDRLVYGAVADFLNMSCCGIDNPYAFNVADVAIFAGAIGLALFGADGKKAT